MSASQQPTTAWPHLRQMQSTSRRPVVRRRHRPPSPAKVALACRDVSMSASHTAWWEGVEEPWYRVLQTNLRKRGMG